MFPFRISSWKYKQKWVVCIFPSYWCRRKLTAYFAYNRFKKMYLYVLALFSCPCRTELLFNFYLCVISGYTVFYHRVYFTTVCLCPVTFGCAPVFPYNAVAVNNCTKVSSSTWKSVHGWISELRLLGQGLLACIYITVCLLCQAGLSEKQMGIGGYVCYNTHVILYIVQYKIIIIRNWLTPMEKQYRGSSKN